MHKNLVFSWKTCGRCAPLTRNSLEDVVLFFRNEEFLDFKNRGTSSRELRVSGAHLPHVSHANTMVFMHSAQGALQYRKCIQKTIVNHLASSCAISSDLRWWSLTSFCLIWSSLDITLHIAHKCISLHLTSSYQVSSYHILFYSVSSYLALLYLIVC